MTEPLGATATSAESKPLFDKAECKRVVTLIAEQLHETDPQALYQLHRIVRVVGPEQALVELQQTLEVEASGGVMTLDGSRRRTPGGAFFFQVHGKYPRTRVKKPQGKKPAQETPAGNTKEGKTEQPQKPAPFVWADRIRALDEIGAEKGQATTVKITLIGRPGKIIDRGTCIMTSMKNTKTPMLPKGMPAPSTFQTNYVVYVASKQWKNVAESIKDEEDMLIVEGFPQLDPETSSIAVFATNTTTKKLQAAKRAKPD